VIEKNIIRIVNSTTETKLQLNTKKCEIMTILLDVRNDDCTKTCHFKIKNQNILWEEALNLPRLNSLHSISLAPTALGHPSFINDIRLSFCQL